MQITLTSCSDSVYSVTSGVRQKSKRKIISLINWMVPYSIRVHFLDFCCVFSFLFNQDEVANCLGRRWEFYFKFKNFLGFLGNWEFLRKRHDWIESRAEPQSWTQTDWKRLHYVLLLILGEVLLKIVIFLFFPFSFIFWYFQPRDIFISALKN